MAVQQSSQLLESNDPCFKEDDFCSEDNKFHVLDEINDGLINVNVHSTENILPTTDEKNFTTSNKKKKRNLTKSEQESLKAAKLQETHCVFTPCTNCRLKCTENVSLETRQKVNTAFWQLGWLERQYYVVNHVKNVRIKRRRTEAKSMRNHQYTYHILSDDNTEKQVCKVFFLATLGFNPKNDSIIRHAMKSVDPITLHPKEDGRGKATNPSTSIRHEKIRRHIEALNPNVFHYRRVYAPNKRYLPDNLTVADMHDDFLQKNPDDYCSYDVYRSILQEMNICLTKLGQEECELCGRFKIHNKDHTPENLNDDCTLCNEWSLHHQRITEAREKYNKDVEKACASDTEYYCADLEKVIMLPRMEEFKVVAFTRRIVAFNQIFLPLGSNKGKQKSISVLWHEEISGRRKEDIVSAYHTFFLKNRDKKRIVLWLDSCSGQNRNWCLFSFLVYLVNSGEVETDFIELNYFESGHTFMAADSFHRQVELSLKKVKKVYDFVDFENVVGNFNSGNVSVQSLSSFHFRKWADHSSESKLKNLGNQSYLEDIKQIIVTRGSYDIAYNLTYDEKEVLPELDFLKVEVLKYGFPLPEAYKSSRGIPESKKNNIIEKLVPLMPQSRRSFWYNLKVSDALDLIDHYDNEEETVPD